MLRRYLLLVIAAAAGLMAAACAPLSTAATPIADVKAADFEAAISRLEQRDPQSPEALNARLEYADFLSEPGPGDCQQRLATAQSQLDAVAARPAANVLLPLSPPRSAGGEYKIHLARATCGGDQSPLPSELRQALEAARHAVELYRDALDYQSAVIMQFNVAATYHELGDVNEAVSALQSTLVMDREYGFRKDAEDNSGLLLRWTGAAANDSDVAVLMKDFPARSAEFKFKWSSKDADVAVNVTAAGIAGEKIVRSGGTLALKRHIRAEPMGWTVSNEPANGSYDMGDWPPDAKAKQWITTYFLASALLQPPTIEIGSNGDFKAVADPQAFGTSLAAEVSAQAGAIPPGSDPGSAKAAMSDLKPAFLPDFIESKAEQDYGLEAATWIGAKLEQGVWYQMSAPLFLPGLGLGHFMPIWGSNYLALHDVSFAFTRQLPCMTGSSDHLCAEIIVHAIPNADDLKSAFKDVRNEHNLSDKQSPHYWSRTDLRLVIDPDTLLPYLCDTRQTWYNAVDETAKIDPIIESVRTVSTSVYH